MTTWEQSSSPGPPVAGRSPRRLAALAASSLAVLGLAWGSYRVLLDGARAGAFNPPGRAPVAGVLEASPAVRRALVPPAPRPAASAPARKPAAVSTTARKPAAVARPSYVVSVARFTSRSLAEAHARRVRAKGYLATVVQDGAAFRVVTRPYPSEDAARRAARVLTEIGFSASVLAVRQPLSAPRDENSQTGASS
ncbi:MAG: SPOR domain-containing protein [Armatimonadota bacterium]|nr:SPOR domain-containing protein [Armatimonadota bacterium]MDR7401261.1 SPOR domain-containing protein [Armatimonadota bacterium]MDR7402981.1 SPOR domain-containing protein [Armatimonadota bacterium]MDR7437155.1 SPOR domain-containing protein [Armatimonadota bacterium]MDR7471907.1 SPOR domain-containing protein [Armatimonadota bacterium]